MDVVKLLIPEEKWGIKCPYNMNPTTITIHNTANDASARNEAAYAARNNNEVSYHYVVDNVEAIQIIEENRNAWHAADGNGQGNRSSIAIEICYSKSGGNRWEKAKDNACILISEILKRRGWGLDKIKRHIDWNKSSGCPHRILAEGWEHFYHRIVETYNGNYNSVVVITPQPSPIPQKDYGLEEIARKVISGAYGNGADRIQNLTNAGYNYDEVQAKVNELLGVSAPQVNTAPANIDRIAREVINGIWGVGNDRLNRLRAAGHDYDTVQNRVNELLGYTSNLNDNTEDIARQVIRGDYGDGEDRKRRLTEAGYDYQTIQNKVNQLLG